MKIYKGLIDVAEYETDKVTRTSIIEDKVIRVTDLLKYLEDAVDKVAPISTKVRVERLILKLRSDD